MDDQKKGAPSWGRRSFGELTRRWPKNADGVEDAPVYLCHCTGRDIDDIMLLSCMESYGIPCLTKYPNDGEFGKLILGMSGTGVDVFVPESMWADACELLKEPEETEEE